MKTLLKFSLAAAVSYFVIDAILKRSSQEAMPDAVDASNPPSSIDAIPTLNAAGDDELDLTVAQNSPL